MTSVVSPVCFGCTHMYPSGPNHDLKCDAYPSDIPWDILLSKVDHRQPYPGDNGVVFEPKSPEDEQYAQLIFDTE